MNYKKIFADLQNLLSDPIYSIPKRQSQSDYFPAFLESKLSEYVSFYKNNLRPIVNKLPILEDVKEPKILLHIELLSEGINNAILDYFEGKILTATTKFNDALKDVLYSDIKPVIELDSNNTFFRARIIQDQPFRTEDMFHVPFQLRNIVSTNRYSIPGLPALYVGDSTYLCWEEFNRYRFRDLSFSCLSNSKKLNVISIQRSEDFLASICDGELLDDLIQMLFYITLFPLTLACSICVNSAKSVFKPEYIIPQLLLQFIKDDSKLDGIKYSSTKVDYSKLVNVPAYNYVFPVKQISHEGFCPALRSIFQITAPTSLEIEELIENPVKQNGFIFSSFGQPTNNKPRQLNFYEGSVRGYDFTSFGYIEEKLKTRILQTLQ
ncbi:hypothetical protein HDF24_06850 [Mucilaginibacter sp. X4EP1]|uniref:hypothetical protein n=1 Tax=Mucilaginibacter sp. X4EP1 TaxID=2723092 RepID=UPI0021699762|nr:hypothetical protein [Mucilaginibacter sp. X4EP1]MCS3814025.1 hypothetical protein [Mucilaginibacter sp. X4EP1]